ncbi:APC family permease [Sphingomonas mesophila]|uniref:APC family permease n=1 Tax=Sphingomonas mesophila TaxID=2303576 RepID=UPI000E5759D6|nr:amino acid permease [Sphingomonas mesophila]
MVRQDEDKLGPWMTMALAVGSIIGAGIFMLPVALAPLGPNAVAGWLISGIGALCIAFALSRLITSDGEGLQAYVERSFGPLAGFVVAWSFCASQWAANAALAIAAASAVARLVPGLAEPGSIALVAIGFIAFLAFVNALGARAMGRLAVLTTPIKLVPLLAVIVLVSVTGAQGQALAPLAPIPMTINTIATAAALTLFALTGFENATAPVGKVRDPERNIPRALILGTAFVALLYLLASTSVLLLLPSAAAEASTAPFADALASRWGESAAILAALGMAVSAFGGLNNGIMVAGELGYSMAVRRDLPAVLAATRGRGTPIAAQLMAAAVASLLVLSNASKTTAGLFSFVILLSTSSVLLVYFIGGLAALKQRPAPLAAAIIVVGLLFSLFAFYGSGLDANLWGLALLAFGLVVRFGVRRASGSSPAAAGAPAAPRE